MAGFDRRRRNSSLMNDNQKPQKADSRSSAGASSPAKPADRRAGAASWQVIPWDVGGRIGILFTALCLIKLFMLAGFRDHLVEIHWRIDPSAGNSQKPFVFFVFLALVGLSLWRLGKDCSPGGPRAVRAANGCVLALGAAFIFLTFRAGESNYLSILLDGTLKWQDLGPYLRLTFFFQPPFLAAWLLVYALTYYVLVRTGREHMALSVTAVFAVLYAAFFLKDLGVSRNSLCVADCLGIACLLIASVFRQPVNWFCLMLPWLGIGFMFLMFREKVPNLMNLDPEFAILCGWSVVLFGGLSVLAWRRKFYSAWAGFWPFAAGSFLLLTCTNYPTSANFQNLLNLGLTLPRYFLGEIFLALVLLAAAKLYRQWLPRASLLWLDAVNVILILLALADLRLSQIMGLRLDWQVIAFGADVKMMWRESEPYLPSLITALIFATALYVILVGLWQRGPVAKSAPPGPSGWFLLVSLLLLGFVGYWIVPPDKAEGESAMVLAETSPLFKETANPLMEKKAFLDAIRQLGMETIVQPPASSPARPLRRMNVLLIFQESSYNKYLSLFDGRENTQPLLSKYKNRMELFPNFFSNFAASINSRFAAFTGLYPVRDYKVFTRDRVGVKSIFDIMHGAGYQCSLFDSSYLDYTGFRDLLQGRGLNAMYDADTMPGRKTKPSVSWGLSEEDTTRAIRAQIQAYATNGQPFFLTYVPVAPHNPFDGVPDQFCKYRLKDLNDYTPSYLNDLLFMDSCLSSILDQLQASGLMDNTLVIITDDHGEMLGENGGPIGHGWATPPDLTNIPLIIMDPGNPGYHLNDTIGSQVDLLPTILDLLGLPLPDDQLYQGASLYSATAQTDRTIYLNSFQQFGIIQGSRYICGSRETGGGDPAHDSSVKVYEITNDDAHTRFPRIELPGGTSPVIGPFDQFQENFLKNYPSYCQMIRN
jgi:hypothetical protein